MGPEAELRTLYIDLIQKCMTNTIYIVDDYGAMGGCRAATNDFRKQRGIISPIQNIDGIGVYWQKM